MEKEKISIYVSNKLKKDLERLAKNEKRPLTKQIEMILEIYLEKLKK